MQVMIHRVKKRPVAAMNVVPYIDVMLVLLVIFMVTTPLLEQGVEVKLPQASSEPIKAQDDKPLVLTVDKQGLYYLNQGGDAKQPLSDQAVIQQVSQLLTDKPELSVLVRGDQAVDYGKVVQAMVLLQRAGLKNVGLMTDPTE